MRIQCVLKSDIDRQITQHSPFTLPCGQASKMAAWKSHGEASPPSVTRHLHGSAASQSTLSCAVSLSLTHTPTNRLSAILALLPPSDWKHSAFRTIAGVCLCGNGCREKGGCVLLTVPSVTSRTREDGGSGYPDVSPRTHVHACLNVSTLAGRGKNVRGRPRNPDDRKLVDFTRSRSHLRLSTLLF